MEPVPDEALSDVCVRGQYAAGEIGGEKVIAYRQEKDVSPGSLTETYAAWKLSIDNWRGGGGPFYLRTGKRPERGVSEIATPFPPVPPPLSGHPGGARLESTLLVLNIQLEEGFFRRGGPKSPGPSICVQPVE